MGFLHHGRWSGDGPRLVFRASRTLRGHGLRERTTRQAGVWDHNAAPAIADFQQFVNRNISEGVDAATSIGLWVVWNLFGSAPHDSGIAAAPAIGSLVIDCLHKWETQTPNHAMEPDPGTPQF